MIDPCCFEFNCNELLGSHLFCDVTQSADEEMLEYCLKRNGIPQFLLGPKRQVLWKLYLLSYVLPPVGFCDNSLMVSGRTHSRPQVHQDHQITLSLHEITHETKLGFGYKFRRHQSGSGTLDLILVER